MLLKLDLWLVDLRNQVRNVWSISGLNTVTIILLMACLSLIKVNDTDQNGYKFTDQNNNTERDYSLFMAGDMKEGPFIIYDRWHIGMRYYSLFMTGWINGGTIHYLCLSDYSLFMTGDMKEGLFIIYGWVTWRRDYSIFMTGDMKEGPFII